jgi:hypothetical protein
MTYSRLITITNWQSIQNKFKNTALLFADKRNLILSAEERAWVAEQILPDINTFTGLEHKVANAIIFIQQPKTKGILHVDGIKPGRAGHPDWAVNIPITTSDAEMSWYEGDYTLKTKDNRGLAYLDIAWTYGPNLAKTVKVDHPMIVDIDTPHSVTNFSDHVRMILSVRFSPDLPISE